MKHLPVTIITIATLSSLIFVGGNIAAGSAILGGSLPQPLPVFPPDNWWNLDISSAPVDPGSSSYISFVGGSSRRLHPDFGSTASPGSMDSYGIPYIVVDGTQPKKTVEFQYGGESDGYDPVTGKSIPFYPIPDEAATQPHWVEGGVPGNVDLRSSQDRHILIVDRDNRLLYELWNCYYDGVVWHAGSGAMFDMKTNNRRPDGWTSADAAGLAILPGLIRYDEVSGPDEIRHAFRATVRATNGYVYPASHRAGSNPLALPLGARLRLKASVDLSRFQPAAQKIFRAMKKYGLIIADNGSDMYVTGTFDTQWVNGSFNSDFGALTANDFEVIKLGYQSAQVSQVIYFPHLAVGGGYTTAFSLTNTGTTHSSGSLSLIDGSGMPFDVTWSGAALSSQGIERSTASSTSSSMTVEMAPGATSVFTVSALSSISPTKSGWARLDFTGGALAGVATFRREESGAPPTIAGVFAAVPTGSVTIPMDNNDNKKRYTGFAVANPNAEPIYVYLEVIDTSGTGGLQVRPAALNPLPAYGQTAAFLHEFLDSTLNFRGTVRIAADNGKQFVAVALQEVHGMYTAIPVMK
ncbi:MAG TPA: hypothetical protein VE398_02395 [Acidobacteriota bacterium]|nr:hypothetical protein [Acidobacteriota bacterium]